MPMPAGHSQLTFSAETSELQPKRVPTVAPKLPAEVDNLTHAFENLSLCVLSGPPSSSGTLEVQLVHESAQMPRKAHADDAGFDVSCIMPLAIEPKERKVVPLGLAVRAPPGTYLRIAPRSGLASKGIAVLGGVVDSNYTGEVSAILFNTGAETVHFSTGDRIAQIIPTKIVHPTPVQVRSLKDTDRGASGVGSSGIGGRAQLRMAAIRTLHVQTSTSPSDSYSGDRKLEKIAEQLTSDATPESRAAKETLAKYHMHEGTLFKKGRRCVGKKQDRERLVTAGKQAKAKTFPKHVLRRQ